MGMRGSRVQAAGNELLIHWRGLAEKRLGLKSRIRRTKSPSIKSYRTDSPMYLMKNMTGSDRTSGWVSGKALASLLETTSANGLARSRQIRTLDRICLRWLSEVKT